MGKARCRATGKDSISLWAGSQASWNLEPPTALLSPQRLSGAQGAAHALNTSVLCWMGPGTAGEGHRHHLGPAMPGRWNPQPCLASTV